MLRSVKSIQILFPFEEIFIAHISIIAIFIIELNLLNLVEKSRMIDRDDNENEWKKKQNSRTITISFLVLNGPT